MSAENQGRQPRRGTAQQADVPPPVMIASREEFAGALDALRRQPDAGGGRVTLQVLARAAGIPVSTLHSYVSGRSLPPAETLRALLAGLGVPPREQAGWVDALERLQPVRQPRSASAPQTMASPVRDFVGRRDVLDQMTLAWRESGSRGPLLLLTGPGGIGKTSVALEWAFRRRADFPDGALQVDLGGFGQREPMTAGRAQRQVLTSLGLRVADLPADPGELTSTYRTELAARRAVLLLDNARDDDVLEALLPHAPHMTTIVTSRDTLRRVHRAQAVATIRVPLMDAAESSVLLERAAGGPTDPDRVAALATSCAGLPLALRLSAESLGIPAKDADRHRSLRLMVAGHDVGVRGVVTSSLGVLDDTVRELFVRLGAIPGRWLEPHAIAVVAGSDATTLAALDALEGVNLLTVSGPAWQRHDLVGEVAAELADQQADTPDLRLALLLHHVAVARSLLGTTSRLLEPLGVDVPPLAEPELVDPDRVRDHEIDSIVSLMGWALDAGHHLAVAALLDALSYDARDKGGQESLDRTLHRLADDPSAPDVARFTACRIIARAHYDMGRAAEQIAWYERALDAVAGRGADDPVRLPVLSALGVALDYEGRRDEAVAMLQHGIDIAAASGLWLHHAICENNLATTLLIGSRYESCLDHIDIAVASAERAGAGDITVMPLCNAVRACLELARLDPGAGWLVRADHYLGLLDGVVDEATASIRERLASCFVHAEVASVRGDLAEGLRQARRADALAEQSGLAWATTMAMQLWTIVLQEGGQYERARGALDEAIAQATETHDTVALVSLSVTLAEVAAASGQIDEARRSLARARDLAASTGTHQDSGRIDLLEQRLRDQEHRPPGQAEPTEA